MKKILLTFFMFVVAIPACFAATNNPPLDTKLYLIDANTGGRVTANTTTITVFAKVKADVGDGTQSLALTTDLTGIQIIDFNGNVIMDSSLPFKPVPLADFQGIVGLAGFGETSVLLGNIKILNPKGKYIHPSKGVMINAYIEYDPTVGNGAAYSISRASEIINFNEPDLK